MVRKELGLYLKIFRYHFRINDFFYLPVAPNTDLLTRLQQQREQKLSPQWRQYCCKRTNALTQDHLHKGILSLLGGLSSLPSHARWRGLLMISFKIAGNHNNMGGRRQNHTRMRVTRKVVLGMRKHLFTWKKLFISNSTKNFSLTAKAGSNYGETIMICSLCLEL